MSTLKELTSEKHREAESQPFLKSIFAGNVDRKKYSEYLYQLLMVYNVLENKADCPTATLLEPVAVVVFAA